MDDRRLSDAPGRSATGFLAKFAGAVVILALAALLLLWGVQRYVANRLSPDPTTVASASRTDCPPSLHAMSRW
jgi:hypothetical protein